MTTVQEHETFCEEMVDAGHSACPGCGAMVALRQVMAALGRQAVVFAPASCGSLYFGIEHATVQVPVINTVYASAFGQAAGYSRALRRRGDEGTQVVVWGGDGAFHDIGMDGLSHIAGQNYDVVAVCNDNQGYMNTGGHSSGGTPKGAITRITPEGYNRQPKNLMEIMAAHRVPYAASICAAFPQDLRAKVEKARAVRGFTFLHLLTSCVNWQHASDAGIRLVRTAVNARIHPLYEVFDGREYVINYAPERRVSVAEYVGQQGRFNGEDPSEFQAMVDARWDDLWLKARGIVRPA
ncbi:MAG: thiamine pyrophosphate-dependent enzyme [Candidatus Latescibacterota bacterium]